MRKFIAALILVPLAILMVMFAVANRGSVAISLDPFSAANNRWRLPATRKETDEEIKGRLRNHCRFWEYYFTWALDKLMGPTTPVRYWSAQELTSALRDAGFDVRRHAMLDFLPYPHVLYIATRRP